MREYSNSVGLGSHSFSTQMASRERQVLWSVISIAGRNDMNVVCSWRVVARRLLPLVGAGLVFLLGTSSAYACGGFFCGGPAQATLQAGERILFAVDEDNIRAYIQVFYEGEADDFAWVIPVASKPDVGVGTDEVFLALEAMTSPQFLLETQIESSCWQYNISPPDFDDGEFNEGGEGEGGETSTEDPVVSVLEEAEVGPYNYVILESNNSQALIAWLDENDYTQPPEAHALIDHYVANEMKFVAVKLLKDKEAGDVTPIILDFEEQNTCVPLMLTQVAATPDMPVKVYLLGETRAVPMNWLHVDINLKKFDWLSMFTGVEGPASSGYDDLLVEAVQEAEGHAFTTEYAGSSSILKNRIYSGQYDGVEFLQELDQAKHFVLLMQEFFTGDAEVLAILEKYISVPPGVDAQTFFNNPGFYYQDYDAQDVDLEALYQELMDTIVTPLKEGQAMFDAHPYLTALNTRIGIDAMDRDPIFGFQDVGDVSNQHTAVLHMECSEGTVQYFIELEDGETFVPEAPEHWDLPSGASTADDLENEPAAAEIQIFAEGVEPRVVDPEFVAFVDEQLDVMDSSIVDINPGTNPGQKPLEGSKMDAEAVSSEGGCNGTSAPTSSWFFLLVGLFSFFALTLGRQESQLDQ